MVVKQESLVVVDTKAIKNFISYPKIPNSFNLDTIWVSYRQKTVIGSIVCSPWKNQHSEKLQLMHELSKVVNKKVLETLTTFPKLSIALNFDIRQVSYNQKIVEGSIVYASHRKKVNI